MEGIYKNFRFLNFGHLDVFLKNGWVIAVSKRVVRVTIKFSGETTVFLKRWTTVHGSILSFTYSLHGNNIFFPYVH